jgi:hypothetical protein
MAQPVIRGRADSRQGVTRRGGDDRVVSMDQFEHFKENIQPVKSGRSAAALVSAAPSPSSSSAASVELEMRKMEFEKRVSDDERNGVVNPLLTWLEYIKWARVCNPPSLSDTLTHIHSIP